MLKFLVFKLCYKIHYDFVFAIEKFVFFDDVVGVEHVTGVSVQLLIVALAEDLFVYILRLNRRNCEHASQCFFEFVFYWFFVNRNARLWSLFLLLFFVSLVIFMKFVYDILPSEIGNNLELIYQIRNLDEGDWEVSRLGH